MTDPLSTTGVDVDAVPEVTTQESQAPAGAPAGGAMPTVGTNARSEWAMWDPNQWWTDWSLPPDPRPSWELWFDWVNQLQAASPSLGEASRDWETMISQLDESLQSVRAMRGELANWNGPSAQTMSDSLDRLENSITTKSAAIQENPAKLQQLSQAINEAVPPMEALDAEYQQVLNDLNACRQVAERGKPIMLNLATQLLQTGTDLENSVRTDNLAPAPVPPQPLALGSGPQGSTEQLQQVAGSSNLSDPGAVSAAAGVPVADQPGVAGTGNLTDPGHVQQATGTGVSTVPGVAVGQQDASVSNPAAAAESGQATASPTLAGVTGGGAAPAVPSTPVGAPAATVAGGPMPAATPFVAAPVTSVTPPAAVSGAVPATPVVGPSVAPPEERRDRKDGPHVLGVPVVPAGAAAGAASGSAAVPTGLRGRTGQPAQPVPARTEPVSAKKTPRVPGVPDEVKPLDAEAFTVEDAGGGTVTAPR